MLNFRELPAEFAAVPEDEMAFALTYFVSAANQRIGPLGGADGSAQIGVDCDRLLAALLPPQRAKPAHLYMRRKDEATLTATFRAVCIHYSGSENLVPLCARVLAFYLLMEHSAGAVLEGWAQEDPEDECLMQLNPGVVEAIASVPLGPSVLLPEPQFLAWLHARNPGEMKHPTPDCTCNR